MTRRRVMLVILPLVLALGTIALIVYRVVRTLNGLPDAYAKWDAGDLVVDYLAHHDAKWPGDWEDLRESFERLSAPGAPGVPGAQSESGARTMRGGMTFDELKRRIGIDWGANPAALATAQPNRKSQPFRVIWAQDRNETTWEDAEPNEMVLDYLRSRSSPDVNARGAEQAHPRQ